VHAVGFYLRIWPGLHRQARQVAQIIRHVRPELVHLNDAVCVSRVGILAARSAGCRLSATCGPWIRVTTMTAGCRALCAATSASPRQWMITSIAWEDGWRQVG